MKFIIALCLLAFGGCATGDKILKKCRELGEDYWVCEEQVK